MSPRHVYFPIVFISLSLLVFNGCGMTVHQRAAAEKFSAATIDLAAVAETEFTKSRTDVIQMNAFRVKLDDKAVDPQKLDSYFTLDEVKTRLDGVDALKEFGEALHTLVTSSQDAELKNAADSLVTSLRKVKGVSLSDEKAGAVGSAIQEIGGLWIEHLRAKAVRDVVQNVQTSIEDLLNLIERDFNPNADHWSLGYDATVVSLRGAAALAEKRRAENDISGMALIKEARMLGDSNRVKFALISRKVLETISNFRKALTNLKYVLQSTDITPEDINNYASQAQDLVKTYKVLRHQ